MLQMGEKTAMRFKTFYLLGATLLFAACDSYSAQQYQSNPQTTIALQSVAAAGRRASVSEVTLADGINPRPTCRLAGPIDIGGGGDVTTVFQQAFLAELLAADVYRADGTPLSIVVTELDPDSVSGNWTIGVRVSSPRGVINVRQVTKFSTSFAAVSACNNTATAFNRALGATILAVIQDPNFRTLL